MLKRDDAGWDMRLDTQMTVYDLSPSLYIYDDAIPVLQCGESGCDHRRISDQS